MGTRTTIQDCPIKFSSIKRGFIRHLWTCKKALSVSSKLQLYCNDFMNLNASWLTIQGFSTIQIIKRQDYGRVQI